MATCISPMFRTLQPGFEAATASRWQKCPKRAPGGPAGESRALRPAPRATAGPAAPAGVQLGREGDKRGPGGAPRPPGRLNLEDMAALWCPGQGPVVRCRCGPALPSYAPPRRHVRDCRQMSAIVSRSCPSVVTVGFLALRTIVTDSGNWCNLPGIDVSERFCSGVPERV